MAAEFKKPRERTKALVGVVQEVLAAKKHIYGQLGGAVAHRHTFSARFLQLAG